MKKVFGIAAMLLALSACNKIESENKAEGIPFTATISLSANEVTKALAESGSTLEATWAVGEKVALIHNGKCDEMEVESVNAGSATITGTITGSPSDGDAVTIIYPYSAVDLAYGTVKSNLLSAQDGTLTGTSGTSIAEKYDVRKGNGTLKVEGTATLNGSVSLTNKNAIFKLTLKDIDGAADVSAVSLKIYNQDNTLLTTVTPASGYEKAMYVALPTTATTLKFAVNDGTTKYFNMASGLSLSSKYYQSTLKLATVGDVILSSGKCAKSGTSGAVAMIAYLGSDSDCTNGLAIQLNINNDAQKNKKWDVAKTGAAGLTSVPGGIWRLPSKEDWENMFVACAVSGDASVFDVENTPYSIAGFKNKLPSDVATWMSTKYLWTSSTSNDNAWHAFFYLTTSTPNVKFNKNSMSELYCYVGCLAF